MNPQEKGTTCFVTWNTRGIKSPKGSLQKCLDVLSKVHAEVAFIQETHVGPKCYKILEQVRGWKVYFTVHSPRSKGVAILIRDDVPFEYICHDEDCSGSYIVLFCRLHGELYTLVNVYNHKKDRSVLNQLKDYLQDTADGVLVVGGDFNTVLDQYFDRRTMAGHTESSSLRIILEDFTTSLNLRDTWAHLHPTERGFTRSDKNSKSRLDMFFMPENTIDRLYSCEIYNCTGPEKISDHNPVVLKLRVQQQSVHGIPDVASVLVEFGYNGKPDRRPEKISGAEILSAIKSLTDSGEESPDKLTVNHYKMFCCPMTEVLKINYNLMLKNCEIPQGFNKHQQSGNGHVFNVDYMIFSQILAKRLKVFITPSFRRQKRTELDIKTTRVTIQYDKIKTSFLDRIVSNLKPIHLAPPHDFQILKNLLPECSPGEFRCLQQGWPLTNVIISLALKQLQHQILKTDSKASICYYRHALLIRTKQNGCETVHNVMTQFMEDSGIKLKIQDFWSNNTDLIYSI